MDLKPRHEYRVVGRRLVDGAPSNEIETFERLRYRGRVRFNAAGAPPESATMADAFQVGSDNHYVLFKPDTFEFEELEG